jgi:antitoxin HicB
MRGMRRSRGRAPEMTEEAAMALSDRAASYLKQPYARIVIPETDGTYRGEILEFPGCIATGDTPAEALEALEEVAIEWLNAALTNNQPIPAPLENAEFSGRLVLRMPKSLHKKAARIAERDGVSLNHFIVTSLAVYVGERVWSPNVMSFQTVISNPKAEPYSEASGSSSELASSAPPRSGSRTRRRRSERA